MGMGGRDGWFNSSDLRMRKLQGGRGGGMNGEIGIDMYILLILCIK